MARSNVDKMYAEYPFLEQIRPRIKAASAQVKRWDEKFFAMSPVVYYGGHRYTYKFFLLDGQGAVVARVGECRIPFRTRDENAGQALARIGAAAASRVQYAVFLGDNSGSLPAVILYKRDSGRVAKARLQEFRRNEQLQVTEVRGREAFKAFLDKELAVLGLSHWYVGDEFGIGPHYIGIPKKRNPLLKTLIGRADPVIAQIEAEPDSPSHEIASDAFRIRVLNAEMRPKMQQLAEAFGTAGFGLPVKIID